MLDRGSEREMLEQLVAGVCAGQSRVLVLRGEAGVESEMELAFAGLHALCAPMLAASGGCRVRSAMR